MKNPYYNPTSQSQLLHGDAHLTGSKSTVDDVMQTIADGGCDKDCISREQWIESLNEGGVLERIAIIIAEEYWNEDFKRFHAMMEKHIKMALE
jgi:hypothetical protein